MKLEGIVLSWVRGAGERAVLETGNNSVAVYGANASGKSTFPDALEYLVTGGRIYHLAHEYSGRRQELGVRNTHAPEDALAIIAIRFEGGAWVEMTVAPDGSPSLTADCDDTLDTIRSWQAPRLILRQDSLLDFIHSTKGEKYSALLPLLGLDSLENAAENLRLLAESVRERGRLAVLDQQIERMRSEVAPFFPDATPESATNRLKELSERYLAGESVQGFSNLVAGLRTRIAAKIETVQPEDRLHLLLTQIKDERLSDRLEKCERTERDARARIDALLDRKIAVLEQTKRFLEQVQDGRVRVRCPACGQMVELAELKAHVDGELSASTDLRSARGEALRARHSLSDSLEKSLALVNQEPVSGWLSQEPQRDCASALRQLRTVSLPPPDEGWSVQDWQALKKSVPVIEHSVRAATKIPPPSAVELVEDKRITDAAASIEHIQKLESRCERLRSLAEAIAVLERAVRAAIRQRTKSIIDEISSEIQHLWSILHPAEPIENIQLYTPHDADKAIDIGLTFFGKQQPSPRLTLSEGYRNSLGLCIFLALAKLDAAAPDFIVLDDVISSLDREHRGTFVDVLLNDFHDRQLLLFTHDREWFSELRWRLPAREWRFSRLRSWESPETGLAWCDRGSTFEDARTLVSQNPEAAGNRVRATMDLELAIIAENLKILVRFAMGDRNDRRTCIEFLERIISGAQRRLRRRDGDTWREYPEAVEDLREAHRLLVPWGNRASHAGTLVKAEVEQLIQVCESALSRFRCSSCGDPIWISHQANRECVQCNCGEVRWKYD